MWGIKRYLSRRKLVLNTAFEAGIPGIPTGFGSQSSGTVTSQEEWRREQEQSPHTGCLTLPEDPAGPLQLEGSLQVWPTSEPWAKRAFILNKWFLQCYLVLEIERGSRHLGLCLYKKYLQQSSHSNKVRIFSVPQKGMQSSETKEDPNLN